MLAPIQHFDGANLPQEMMNPRLPTPWPECQSLFRTGNVGMLYWRLAGHLAAHVKRSPANGTDQHA